MKKRIATFLTCGLLTAALVFIPFKVKAQEFDLGDKVLNFGIGIGSTWGLSGSTTLPPLSVSFDYALRDDIGPGILGVGGIIGYESHKWTATWSGGEYGWKQSRLLIAAMGTYHYELVENLDTYAGIILGFRSNSYKEIGDYPYWDYSSTSSGIDGGFFVGGKYFFSDNLGAFAEFGYHMAWLTLGISLRM